MKKVLFTLATLLAFGATVNAQQLPAPKLAFGTDANNLITEVEVTPGESVELKVVRVEQQELVVQGFAIQWKMLNSAGQPETTNVVCPKVYGGRTKTWTNPEGYSTPDEDLGGVIGNSLASQILEGYIYRWVGTNTSSNQFWWNSDADGNSPMPDVVGTFTIQTTEAWDDDYATFVFDTAYGIYNQTANETSASQGYEVRLDDSYAMSLKIINKDKEPTPVTVADPVISFAEENNILTVTVTAEEGATLIVNGEEVEGNPYVYTVEHENLLEEQVVNVTAQAKKGDVTSNEVTDSYTFQAQQEQQAETPVITFNENPYNGQISSVQVVVTNATSYTIKVNGEVYNSNFIQAGYDAEKVIVVEAENNPGAPYTPAYATDTYTLNKLNKKAANAPTITTNTTADAVVVTVTKDPNTDGDLVYDGDYSYPRQDADYEVTVTAYTTEGDTYQASEPTTLTFTVPAYVPPTPVETTTFVKVTSADQLVAGKHYILVAGEYAMGAVTNNSTAAGVAITLNGDEAEATEDVTILTLGEPMTQFSQTYWPVQLPDGKYLAVGGSNKFKIVDAASSTYYMWKISTSNFSMTDGDYNYPIKKSRLNDFGPTTSTSETTYAVLYVEKPGETPVLEDLTGNIVVSEPDENGVVTVTYDGPETVTITVNGEPVAESYQLEDGVPMTFEVVVSAEGYNDKTAEETRTWNKPAPVLLDLAGEIVVSEPDENGVVTVSYVPGEGDPETVTITVNGEPVAESYQLEDGVPMTFEVVVSAEGYNDKTATESRTWTKPAPTVWADPVIVIDDAVSEDGFLYATITWEEGGTLYIDGEEVVGYTSPYRYKIAAQALYDQEGAFFCQVKGEGRENSNNVRTAWNLPAREATYAPAPVLNWNEETFTMTATLDRGHEIVLMKDGVVVENPCIVEQTYVEQTIMFSAYTTKEGEDYDSEVVYKQVTVPAKQKQDSATPVITVTEGDDAYTISADPCTQLLVDGEEVTNPYTVNRPAEGEEDLVIFVTAINNEGEGYNDATATQRVVIPAKEPVTPDYTPVAPKVTIQTNDEDVVVEGIIEGAAADHGTVTLYTVDEEGVRHEVENPESFAREDEDYVVTVIAVATYENGEVMESEPVAVTITKKEQQPDPTSINEMNGGKTVASVRYFNMAGQEMQEANGMTIVVTTYTDGTSSAVKVMK